MSLNFECKKCGYCCKTLLEYEGGVLMGLALLTEEEKKLFDEKDISPAFGFGNEISPTQIASYQLNLAKCPHIAENNRCKIYDKKPLACRAYPITSNIGRNVADLKCPQVGKYSESELCHLMFSDMYEEAVNKINCCVGSFFRKYGKKNRLMRFDLASKKWKAV
jgi:Fe-S-cluster containining protein